MLIRYEKDLVWAFNFLLCTRTGSKKPDYQAPNLLSFVCVTLALTVVPLFMLDTLGICIHVRDQNRKRTRAVTLLGKPFGSLVH